MTRDSRPSFLAVVNLSFSSDALRNVPVGYSKAASFDIIKSIEGNPPFNANICPHFVSHEKIAKIIYIEVHVYSTKIKSNLNYSPRLDFTNPTSVNNSG